MVTLGANTWQETLWESGKVAGEEGALREERWLMTKPPTADCGEVVRAKALEEDILEVWENLPDLL